MRQGYCYTCLAIGGGISVGSLKKIPGGGGSASRGGGAGGRVSAGIWGRGGGLNIFSRGRNSHKLMKQPHKTSMLERRGIQDMTFISISFLDNILDKDNYIALLDSLAHLLLLQRLLVKAKSPPPPKCQSSSGKKKNMMIIKRITVAGRRFRARVR